MLRRVLVTWIVLHFRLISVIHVHNEHTAKDEGLHAVVLSSFRKKASRSLVKKADRKKGFTQKTMDCALTFIRADNHYVRG